MHDRELRLQTTEELPDARTPHDSALKTVAARKKTRVLMVGMHLTKTRGGISTLVAEILKSSLKNDFDFYYIESQAEDFGGFGKFNLMLRAYVRFIKRCVWNVPELVYIHLGSNASLYRESFFIVLAKLLGLKTAAHFHAGDIDNYYPRQNFIGRAFIRRAINSSDVLIAVSDESARQLRTLAGAPDLAVIPNAIDTTSFDAGDRETKNASDTNKAIRILFVGAVGKLKGERDLIRALEILRERGCEFNLKVSFLGYGAESLEPVCQVAGIMNWIEFTGAVPLEKRIEFFRRADIFVLPTYAEAMPMSVIEAMAAGLPVISTKIGGIPELIENDVDGLLFTPGDVADLADKIEYLLKNKSVRFAFGAKAACKVRQKFDIEQYVVKLRGHLLGAISRENE